MALYKLIDRGHFWFCPTYRTTQGVFAGNCLICEFVGYLLLAIFAGAFAGLEFYGAAITASLSLKGDAWHVTADGVGYATSLVGVVLMMQTGDAAKAGRIRNTFTMLLVLLLAFSSARIGVEAYQRYSAPHFEHPIVGDVMFWIAFAGLAGNILMFWMLKRLDLDHHHGGTCHHDYAPNLLRRANIWHTVSDAFASVLVVGIATIAWFHPWETWIVTLDLIGSAAIALLLLYQSVQIARGIAHA
jgi:cation diffusion facilitator family transporter